MVEPQDPKHQMRDRMKDYDAQLKTQILIDNRYGNHGSMNIHHQPMLTRYNPHGNYYRGAGYHPGAPYIPPASVETSQIEPEDEE